MNLAPKVITKTIHAHNITESLILHLNIYTYLIVCYQLHAHKEGAYNCYYETWNTAVILILKPSDILLKNSSLCVYDHHVAVHGFYNCVLQACSLRRFVRYLLHPLFLVDNYTTYGHEHIKAPRNYTSYFNFHAGNEVM